MTREAVIVSYARTGMAKSQRGGFNMTPTVTMAAHAIKHAAIHPHHGAADPVQIVVINYNPLAVVGIEVHGMIRERQQPAHALRHQHGLRCAD